ncbi:MAG: YhgE/Pip domain-containing protein [Bifidobacteriaceae bacterium]|nr:YhgE/Pip domain-containing protein [Bifidobacteriaceae bacterium]
MKNVWKIFSIDIKHAFSNAAALVVVIGLTMLPAVFAWFNVAASWDPFSNTKNLKIAVANSDEGYHSDIVPVTINIGDTVINTLRGNHQLDWQFTDEATAIDGAKSGEYYAAVIIPQDFSDDMMTFFSDNMEHATLTYYQNEKKNGIAPKITGQGANEISAMINTVFTKTMTSVGLDVIDTLAKYLDSDDTRALAVNLDHHIQQLSTQTKSASSVVTTYGTLVDSAQTLLDSSSTLLSMTQQDVDSAKSDIDTAVSSVNDISSALDAASTAVSSSIDSSAQAFSTVSDDLANVLGDAGTDAHDMQQALQQRADSVQQQIDAYTKLRDSLTALRDQIKQEAQSQGIPIDTSALDNAISTIDSTVLGKLDALHSKILAAANYAGQAGSSADEKKDSVLAAANEAKDAINGLKAAYDSQIKANLATISSSAQQASDSLASMSSSLQNAFTDLSQSDGSLTDKLNDLKTTISDISNGLSTASDSLDTIDQGLQKALASNDLTQLTQLVGDDASAFAASLAAPVTVNRHALYPVSSFGTALSPLYTSIALWLGAMLMGLALRCVPDEETLKAVPGSKRWQRYWGRFGIFAVISLAQTTFLAGGQILFLGMECAHPWLYVLCAQISGLVFTFICYSNVATFANVGKAINLTIMVMQIAGSDGGYPLRMLDPIIGDISWFLPATYVIKALRAAIGGIYANDYWLNLLRLAPFVLVFLIIRPLARPLGRFNANFTKQLESTKLF